MEMQNVQYSQVIEVTSQLRLISVKQGRCSAGTEQMSPRQKKMQFIVQNFHRSNRALTFTERGLWPRRDMGTPNT
jgi:hypothetical protein